MIDFRNMDCMELMAEFEDNHFDLAIVDPPYGISVEMYRPFIKKGRSAEYNKNQREIVKYTQKDWDKERPTDEYFEELLRVSKNQIICGAYMFTDVLSVSKSWIVWDKLISNDATFSAVDLFWTSFTNGMKKATFSPFHGTRGGKDRIHPTQKPTALYSWILSYYAKEGDKILDTHVGSASSLIACHHLGFDVVGCELDEEYYRNAQQRIKDETAQMSFI